MADVIKLPSIPPPAEVQKEENCVDEKSSPPAQQQAHSLNSHQHDSEYDTASDLEGGEDGNDYDDEDESLGASAEEDDDVDSENGSVVFDAERQRGDGQENDYAKKVDEDRSNPQYIPKKGTFYEHDDRTADDGTDFRQTVEQRTDEGDEGDTTKSSTPTISAASKVMKKWQPASAVDRWSHDKYDENEQAPKSRSELVLSYGYDIRNEERPPKARRRRPYGRGPTKYVRNWEDENAYIKSSNSQRKPRPEDFPALGDKRRQSRNFHEEKENRYERHTDKNNYRSTVGNASPREIKPERRNSGKTFRSGGRPSMEFKSQNKNRPSNDNQPRNMANRPGERVDNMRRNTDNLKSQVESVSFTNTKATTSSKTDSNNVHENTLIYPTSSHRELKDKMPNVNSYSAGRQPNQTSQLQSRLQLQSINDPSHVGSIQMHSVGTQNEHALPEQSIEPGKTKRYSSKRQRSQNEGVMPPQGGQMDQHGMQQIQVHEHLLQANLMQLYHTQENLQAPIQGVTIQSLPSGHQTKPAFQNVQQPYQASTTNTPAYYAPVSEYANAATSAQAPPNQYPQQQPAAYIQPPAATSQMAAYNAQSPPPGPPATQTIPSALNYVQAPPNTVTSPPYQNFSGYHQNFNTVGGTTYFVPHQQPPPRPVVVPQRRPTNAIPIMAPPTDKGKRLPGDKEDESRCSSTSSASAPLGSAENIDHILDNMFVQRPPYQPPSTRKSSSPATEPFGTSTSGVSEEKPASSTSTGNENTAQQHLEESIKNLSISEEPKFLPPVESPTEQIPTALPSATPSETAQTETG